MEKDTPTIDRVIVVDIEKCLACGSCEISCAVAHSESGNLAAAISEKEKPVSRVTLEKFEDGGIPVICQHCKNAPCVRACPSRAIEQTAGEGPVFLDRQRCGGSGACMRVCPFGAIVKIPGNEIPFKCDLCIHRLKEGLEPACVAACPTGALQFSVPDPSTRKKRAFYVKKYTLLKKRRKEKENQKQEIKESENV